MLMSKSTKVILEETYQKIFYLHEAYNDTFVFLASLGVRQDALVHVNKRGKQLYRYKFPIPVDTLGMINEYEAIVLETRGNAITFINLKTHTQIRMPHYFMNVESDQCNLYTFPITKYMAVVEYGRYNDHRLKITYINYPRNKPQLTQDKLPIHHKQKYVQRIYESKDDDWTYEYQIVKANNHSMVVWYKARHDDEFQFKIFRQDSNYMPLHCHDQSNPNGWDYQIIKIKHGLEELYNFRNLNLAVNEVMQIQKNKLLVYCLSNRDKPLNEKQPIKNSYIVDLLTSNVVESPHNLGSMHERQNDRFFFGNAHMIRTYNYVYGESKKSPVYYFDNETFKVITEDEWVCSYLTKYTFPGYDGFVMLQNQYENNNVTNFTCHYRKLIEHRQVILFLLLQINQNFDQDLLHDVISLTC